MSDTHAAIECALPIAGATTPFIERESDRGSRAISERERILTALLDPTTPPDQYCQLYAAQQAISWIINPRFAAAPFDVIMNGKVQALTADIQAN